MIGKLPPVLVAALLLASPASPTGPTAAPPSRLDSGVAPSGPARAAPLPQAKPALVLLIAVDQMRADYLTRFDEQYVGGFRLLLDKGAVFTQAHQAQAITATAPGHVAMLSGLYPREHGIVDNNWYDRDLQRAETAAEDRGVSVVGLDATSDSSGPSASPRQFRGTTLVDWLRQAQPGSHSVSMSRKDRAAVLMAPSAEQVYWFHWSGRFVTSTYYRDKLPDWVQRYNATDWLSDFAGGSWSLLYAEGEYARSRPDVYVGEVSPRGFGGAFPHRLPTDRRALGDQIVTTPFMDWATLELARAAVENVELGRDDVPDILAISLSATDSVGHTFGPFSREIQDQMLRLDRELAGFFEFIDQSIGLDRVLVVLTSDHGVAPLPEYSRERGDESARRIDVGALLGGLDRHLAQEFGGQRWFSGYSYGWLQLNRAQAAQMQIDPERIVNAAKEYLGRQEDVAAVYSRSDLLVAHEPKDEIEARVHRSFYPSRSGELYIIHPPYSIWHTGSASNHQSPYDYDSHVPLVLLGPWVRTGHYDERVAIVDLAPTLAAILGVPTPADLEGVARREILAH